MDLLERFASGDLEAFERLFQQHHAEVHRWLVRLVRDPGAAEDLTVEVFWRVYRAHARFDPRRSFEAWARRIASNAALDHLRRTRRASAGAVPAQSGRPPASAARRDVEVRVERAFRQLPPKLRIVAQLALIDELAHEDIANALGISRSAVKSRASRALRLLKRAFEREGIAS
jgi:RNA polymerase sigma-70 factor (ECF subfamily)